MAKGGIIIPMKKIKSVLKKLNSSLSRSSSTLSRHSTISPDEDTSSSFSSSSSGGGTHPVFVGKSRRLYHVSADVVHHPLFRELVERSGSGAGEDHESSTAVSCEVVLFEHLLWMLENADDSAMADGQMADFYACW